MIIKISCFLICARKFLLMILYMVLNINTNNESFVARYLLYADISAKAAHMLSLPKVIYIEQKNYIL